MKGYALISLLMAAGFCHAQYDGPYGSTTSGEGDSPLGPWISGPVTTTVYYEYHSHAICWQSLGNPAEPCPWTLEFENLYNNSWNHVYQRQIYVPEGKQIRVRATFLFGSGNQMWIHNQTGLEFERRFDWKDWGPEYIESGDL